MPIYSYKGLNQTGKEVKSTVNAESANLAKQRIRTLGIMLLEIKEQKSEALKHHSSMSFGPGVKVEELSLMTRQLATLIRAKINLVEALSAIVDQAGNPGLKIVMSEVKQKVNEGSSLAKALADYPKVFNNIYINMVDAGEASGNLAIVLVRLAEFTEGQVKLKNKIKGAMTYPIVMVFFGSFMMGIIFIFVIPKITRIFITMKRELPLQTKICIWISNFLQGYWWAVIIGSFSSFFLFKKYISTTSGKKKWHSLLLNLPIIAELLVMINIARFTSTLATLLTSGVPILASLKIVKNLVSNVHMQAAVEEAKINVAEGASLVGPLTKSNLFPSMVTHMIGLGEKSGELEPMLQIIAENYDEQVDAKINGLTSILEPVMMIIMGLAVAFIVFSVVVPMMELNKIH